MKLEVQLDKKTVFTTTFSVALTGRTAIPQRSYSKKIRFSFKPERSIIWSGYRDDDVVSAAKRRIVCDIWMAGADEDGIILGVSFDRCSAILMNTLHLGLPTAVAQSEITGGLMVVTSPVTEKKPNRALHAAAAAPGS